MQHIWKRASCFLEPLSVRDRTASLRFGPKCFAAVAWVLLLCQAALSQSYVASGSKDAPQRGVYEVQLQCAGRPANPYFDVQLEVTFTSPKGTAVKVDGFFDGGQVYKARAYASEVGTWQCARDPIMRVWIRRRDPFA